MIKSINIKKKWEKALDIIPGGNSFFSKRPKVFNNSNWPTYFEKSSGCYVTDINHNKYLDFSLMGVGTCILGYNNKIVNKKVIKAIKKGNVSTLNSYEELNLAEKLVKLHPWAKMVKFARTGGEANAIAIRIARSFTKSEKVAICGYHGWHDWYLSANINKKNSLKNHLMPFLKVKGVPKSLKSTVFSFEYNDYETLEKLVKKEKIKVVKMEFCRETEPNIVFLKKVKKLCKEKSILLIFDECTSGFRECLGGLHLKYKIYPDICIYGKALGNGYPITAIIGKKKIMEEANQSFISSTFWSERIGFVAALSTLEEMKKIKSWKIITEKGKKIKNEWLKIAKKHNFKIEITGISSLISFKILSKNFNNYKRIISEEMLRNKILASNTIYLSVAHKDKYIKKYLRVLNKVFSKLAEIENRI